MRFLPQYPHPTTAILDFRSLIDSSPCVPCPPRRTQLYFQLRALVVPPPTPDELATPTPPGWRILLQQNRPPCYPGTGTLPASAVAMDSRSPLELLPRAYAGVNDRDCEF